MESNMQKSRSRYSNIIGSPTQKINFKQLRDGWKARDKAVNQGKERLGWLDMAGQYNSRRKLEPKACSKLRKTKRSQSSGSMSRLRYRNRHSQKSFKSGRRSK